MELKVSFKSMLSDLNDEVDENEEMKVSSRDSPRRKPFGAEKKIKSSDCHKSTLNFLANQVIPF